MIQRWGIAQKITFGFALGPIALIIIGFIAYTNTNRMLASESVVSNSFAVRNALHRVEQALVDAETGQRGYLLTGNPQYLQPYEQAGRAVGSAMTALNKAVSGEPQQESRAAAISSLSNQKLAELADTLSVARTRGLPAAIAIVRSNRGQSIMDRLRGQFNDALAEQRRIEQTRYTEDANAASWSIGITVWGTALMVVILTVVGVLLTRNVSGPLEDAVSALTSASAEILAGTTQQAAGVQEHAAAVTETVGNDRTDLANGREFQRPCESRRRIVAARGRQRRCRPARRRRHRHGDG